MTASICLPSCGGSAVCLSVAAPRVVIGDGSTIRHVVLLSNQFWREPADYEADTVARPVALIREGIEAIVPDDAAR